MRTVFDSILRRRVLTLAAAAALGLPLASTHALAGTPTLAGAQSPRLLDKNDKNDSKADHKREKASAKENREVFTTVANALDQILEPDLKGLQKLLTSKDADRVSGDLKEEHESYKTVVDQFTNDWQNKYGDKFNASNHLGVLSADRVERTDRNGKDYATVYFDEAAGKPAFELHLVREKSGGDYKIELPDTVSGQALQSRLETNLKGTFDNKNDWPKEQSTAYSEAAHRLLYALRYEEPNDAKK